MPILPSRIDPRSETFIANRRAMLEKLDRLAALQRKAILGGGERYVERHHRRGKLLPRERVELLVDRDSPFLELSPYAAAETEYGIGVVSGTECLILANDPTVRGGAINPYSLAKMLRAYQISIENRLPLVYLVVPGGAMFRNLTRSSGRRVPTIALVFGNSTAGGAYLPGLSDYVVMVRNRAKVFLGGPPLVKMATGEDANDEELGGAEMHATLSGLADYMALDEPDALRLGRRIVARLAWRKLGPGPSAPAHEPHYDSEELLGIPSADMKVPFPIREVIARVVDDSEFDEFKPLYGTNLVTGWARIHGY